MAYVLFNGRYYLNENHKTCANVKDAHIFTTVTSANNFLLNSPKAIQNLGFQPIESDSITNITTEQYSPSTLDTPTPEQADVIINPSYLKEIDIDDFAIRFQELLHQSVDCRQQLLDELHNIEDEIQDILHAIEFQSLDVFKGYKLYKRLHDARIRRREIKDLIQKADIIATSTTIEWRNGKVIQRLNNLKHRKYQPRVLDELFD